MQNEFINGLIACSPGHPVVWGALQACLRSNTRTLITYRTGTAVFSGACRAYMQDHRARVFFAPSMYFHPIDGFHHSLCKDCPYAMMIHENTFSYNPFLQISLGSW